MTAGSKISQPKLSFGDPEYWDRRFENDVEPYDWLQDEHIFDEPIKARLQQRGADPHADPSILHIGCGSSKLSLRLRELASDPRQVLNVDVSEAGVRLGRCMERTQFGKQCATESPNGEHSAERRGTADTSMCWATVNLVDVADIVALAASHGRDFTLVADKGTSDALACAYDVPIQLPYRITPSGSYCEVAQGSIGSASIHPVQLLAVHLAFLCRPGAWWIALSFSNDRLPFLCPGVARDGHDPPSPKDLHIGFPDPADLWKLVRKEAVEASPEPPTTHGTPVHRPTVTHTIYILERTDYGLDDRLPLACSASKMSY
jgi:hypothetical protein